MTAIDKVTEYFKKNDDGIILFNDFLKVLNIRKQDRHNFMRKHFYAGSDIVPTFMDREARRIKISDSIRFVVLTSNTPERVNVEDFYKLFRAKM